jgi:annexin A7/11
MYARTLLTVRQKRQLVCQISDGQVQNYGTGPGNCPSSISTASYPTGPPPSTSYPPGPPPSTSYPPGPPPISSPSKPPLVCQISDGQIQNYGTGPGNCPSSTPTASYPTGPPPSTSYPPGPPPSTSYPPGPPPSTSYPPGPPPSTSYPPGPPISSPSKPPPVCQISDGQIQNYGTGNCPSNTPAARQVTFFPPANFPPTQPPHETFRKMVSTVTAREETPDCPPHVRDCGFIPLGMGP